MTIGERIKRIRMFRGLTQKQLGELTKIHEVAIRKYELNKVTPKFEQLNKIAYALGVPYNALLDISAATDSDVIPLLFAIDDAATIKIIDVKGKAAIQFEHNNFDLFLKDWQAMKQLVENGSQTEETYREWKVLRPGITKKVPE